MKIFQMRRKIWFKNKYKLDISISKSFLLDKELEKIIIWLEKNCIEQSRSLINSPISKYTIGEIAMLREGAEQTIELLKEIASVFQNNGGEKIYEEKDRRKNINEKDKFK